MASNNFGPEITQAQEIPSATTVKEGVSKSNVFLDGMNSMAKEVRQVLRDERGANNERAIADFTQKQLLIADSLDQKTGRVKSAAHAQTLMRQNLITAMEANPLLAEGLLAAQSRILGIEGAANIVRTGSWEERLKKQQIEGLVGAGVLNPDQVNDEQAVNSALSKAQASAAAQAKYDAEMAALDLRAKQLSVGSAEQKAVESQRKAATEDYVKTSTPAEYDRVRNTFNEIINNPDLSVAEKQTALETFYSKWDSDITAALGGVDSDFRAAFKSVFDDMYDNYRDNYATGALDDAAIKRENERVMLKLNQLALADPTIARIAAGTRMFGGEIISQAILDGDTSVFKKYTDFLAGGLPGSGTDPVSILSDDPATQKAAISYMKDVAKMVQSDDPETKAEALERLSYMFENMEDEGGKIIRNPKRANKTVEFLASPEFLSVMKEHPEAFANREAAEDLLNTHYHDEVDAMIQNEFKAANVMYPGSIQKGTLTPEMNNVPTGSIVEAVGSDQGVTFRAIDPKDRRARREAERLNKKLKPIINMSIKARAHINGQTNYQQQWESAADYIFGDQIQGGGDLGDDLSLDSFSSGQSALDQALTTGGFIGSGDYTDAETPAEVAAAFVGFEENEHKNILSSFIKKAVGTNIDPSKTAWCAAFVNAALGVKGTEGTGKLNAQSFLNWGEPVETPSRGDVVVFSRGSEAWMGHVGFYAGEDDNGNILVLGGNQSNKVSIQKYPRSRLLGVRRG